MKEIDQNKVEKYISNQLDINERAEVETLFLEGESNIILRNSLENDFNRFTNDTTIRDEKIDTIFDKINLIIRENEIAESQRPLKRILGIYMKIAAVLLIPLVIAGGFLISSRQTATNGMNESATSSIIAPLGSRIAFTLPDGTSGMLNSGSSLSYSIPFANNRQISLTGEGWFEIKQDTEHPFTINALNSKVIALGTTFNLCAYPDEEFLEVVLNSGKIEFQNNDTKESVFLMPSERLVLKEGTLTKSKIDTSKYNAWTEGKLVFRGDPMDEVVRKLARWYNVNIKLADKQLETYSFRGTFEDDKLEDILAFLAMTSPISYEIFPREQLPDGTLTKENIIIYLLDGGK